MERKEWKVVRETMEKSEAFTFLYVAESNNGFSTNREDALNFTFSEAEAIRAALSTIESMRPIDPNISVWYSIFAN